MKYTGPKARRCRRHGTNIYGSDKYDTILQKKPYTAGKDPKARAGRQSEFGKQLLEKQKARDMFGLSERQFRKLYEIASASSGQTGAMFLKLLESRLDNAIYRAGFAKTRLQSRQLAGHGVFTVNGKRVTTPSYHLKAGDKVAVRSSSKSSPMFGPILEAHEKYMPPKWMKVDAAGIAFDVTGEPSPEDVEQAVDVRQVIEFYSRR
ncbi:30S ribosomal protein S4 [Candidatus Peregrinibacteria bacterium]|nr:30S ribosomal protein S4 [Candidatus Peregrinibacteria bacterium]